MVEIAPLDAARLEAILECDGGNGWKNARSDWVESLRQQAAGQRVVLVASIDDRPVGYGGLLWQSTYPAFATCGIPELHDLVTARDHRHRGVATALIASLEAVARNAGCSRIGLGVGLYADYGPAQRLYGALGYVLDGQGITYRNAPVIPGASVRLDDDLLLWMEKTLA